MVTGGRTDAGDDNLPSFSDPEDFEDDITNEGQLAFISQLNCKLM